MSRLFRRWFYPECDAAMTKSEWDKAVRATSKAHGGAWVNTTTMQAIGGDRYNKRMQVSHLQSRVCRISDCDIQRFVFVLPGISRLRPTFSAQALKAAFKVTGDILEAEHKAREAEDEARATERAIRFWERQDRWMSQTQSSAT